MRNGSRYRASVEELCSHSVSSSQVSAYAARLDVELQSWMEGNIPHGLAIFPLPQPHQKRLRASHALGHVNQELGTPHPYRPIFSMSRFSMNPDTLEQTKTGHRNEEEGATIAH